MNHVAPPALGYLALVVVNLPPPLLSEMLDAT